MFNNGANSNFNYAHGGNDMYPQNALTSADIISLLPAYELYLIEGERSANTVSKYLRDIRAFAEWQREHAHGENGISNRVGTGLRACPPNPAQIENEAPNRVGTGSDGAVPLCRVATFPPHCGGIFQPYTE